MDDLTAYFSSLEEEVSVPGIQQCSRDTRSQLNLHSTKRSIIELLPHVECENCFETDDAEKPTIKDSRVRNSKSCTCLPTMMPTQLPPEVEAGNIEYKRKLVNPTPNRFEQLVTQMNWRLNEGGGEAIYRLGVDDNGHITGLSPTELEGSLATLGRMAKQLNATLHPLRERVLDRMPNKSQEVNHSQIRKAIELLVRQSPSTNDGKPNMCIAVLGGMDAGKSTLIGVLAEGELDNGRGRARLNLFRHLHEVQSGRTSSLSSELLGFDVTGNVTNYTRADGHLIRSSVDELVRTSIQLITLLDSAGHAKYQRTTLAGLASTQPVGVLLVVSACIGLNSVGLEHAKLTMALGLPLAIVISKIDQVQGRDEHIATLCRQVASQLNRIKQDHSQFKNMDIDDPSGPLIFPVSAVTGEGMDALIDFLSRLGRSANAVEERKMQSWLSNSITETARKLQFIRQVERILMVKDQAGDSKFTCFWVSQVFTSVPGVRVPVLFGSVQSGLLCNGQLAWLGPDVMGDFHLIQVMSVHHNRQPHSVIHMGQSACVAVRFITNVQSSSIRGPQSPFNGLDAMSGLMFQMDDNDENQPELDSSGSFATQSTVLRRGVVLLSNQSWSMPLASTKYRSQSLPDIPREIRSVGVAWSVVVQLSTQLIVLPRGEESTSSSVVDVRPALPIVNQRVDFFSGCVSQRAIVLKMDSDEASNTSILHLRFTRYPEYLDVGRSVILMWAAGAKAVGRISHLGETVGAMQSNVCSGQWLTEDAMFEPSTCYKQLSTSSEAQRQTPQRNNTVSFSLEAIPHSLGSISNELEDKLHSQSHHAQPTPLSNMDALWLHSSGSKVEDKSQITNEIESVEFQQTDIIKIASTSTSDIQTVSIPPKVPTTENHIFPTPSTRQPHYRRRRRRKHY